MQRLLQRRFNLTKAVVIMTAAFVLSAAGLTSADPTESYEDLLKTIRETYKPTKDLTEQERVLQAWRIGTLSEQHSEAHKMWSEYTAYINSKLAEDLNLRENEIRDMRQFARVYPELPPQALSWSHYLILIYVHPADQREFFMKQILSEKWSKERLREEVNKLRKEIKKNSPLGTAMPAKWNFFRIVKAQAGEGLALELGFGNEIRIPEPTLLKEGEIVTCGTDPSACHEDTDARPSNLHVYSGQVVEVIDGDTLEAVVDLGFGVSTRQKIRLRGIDAPEIDRSGGFISKEFLYDLMTQQQGRVILRTAGRDNYNRTVADVWVGGEYLNQRLVDERMAVTVQDRP